MSMPSIQAQLSPEWRLPRVREHQEEQLESAFQRDKNPQTGDLAIVAAEVGLNAHEVKVWFQHRLARWRQSQGLPANGGYVNE